MSKLLDALKAWPTREERLRKGLVKRDDEKEPEIVKPDGSTPEQLKRKARLLKLRAAQRKRRRELEDKQRERSDVPEAK